MADFLAKVLAGSDFAGNLGLFHAKNSQKIRFK
jgi:hypothetical protein